jgi:hypothetical protein
VPILLNGGNNSAQSNYYKGDDYISRLTVHRHGTKNDPSNKTTITNTYGKKIMEFMMGFHLINIQAEENFKSE